MVHWSGRGGGEFGAVCKARVEPLLLDFDMVLAKPVSRSVRLNGFATCLRLEEVYWRVLADMAQQHRCTVNALLSNVDREVHLRYGGVKNFSGLIRVVCVMHLTALAGLPQALRNAVHAVPLKDAARR